MVLISKTGLLEGVRKPVKRYEPVKKIEFPNLSRPAPYTLRPFAGVYNPFPYGCSILCNHPADYEAKDVVKKAKDTWAAEEFGTAPLPYADGEDAVPEELFRRYTETDSRPLTPAPTLASGGTTRGSIRRCVTPEPAVKERTHLILDLRRSHSQDTLTGWQNTPQKPAVQPSTASTNYKKKSSAKRKVVTASAIKSDEAVDDKGTGQKLHQQVMQGVKTLPVPIDASDFTTDTTGGSGDEELPRRRGKHRRRRKKSGQNAEPEKEFQGLAEPGETQVSALSDESNIGISTRPSVIVGVLPPEADTVHTDQAAPTVPADVPQSNKDISKSFIDMSILKQLGRALDQEVIDSEFDTKRKIALEEAMRIRNLMYPRHETEEIRQLKQQLQNPPNDLEKWLTKPRNFSRRSARFEVPLDSRLLADMTPMQYISRYVSLTSGRQLLYNRVFNRHKIVLPDEGEDEAINNSERSVDVNRKILGKNVPTALGEVMGHPLSEEQAKYLQNLVGWEDEELLEFRQWAGICALCERLLAPQFMFKLPTRLEDPCSEIEQADFECLSAQIQEMQLDPRLLTILEGICTF